MISASHDNADDNTDQNHLDNGQQHNYHQDRMISDLSSSLSPKVTSTRAPSTADHENDDNSGSDDDDYHHCKDVDEKEVSSSPDVKKHTTGDKSNSIFNDDFLVSTKNDLDLSNLHDQLQLNHNSESTANSSLVASRFPSEENVNDRLFAIDNNNNGSLVNSVVLDAESDEREQQQQQQYSDVNVDDNELQEGEEFEEEDEETVQVVDASTSSASSSFSGTERSDDDIDDNDDNDEMMMTEDIATSTYLQKTLARQDQDPLDLSGTTHEEQQIADRTLGRNVFFENGVESEVENPVMHYLHVGLWYTKSCDYYQHRRPQEGEVKSQAIQWLHNARPRDRFVFLVSNVESGWPEGSVFDQFKQFVYGYAPRFGLSGRREREDQKMRISGRPVGVEVIEVLHSSVTAVDYSPGLVSSRFALECSEVTCIWFEDEYLARKEYCCPIQRVTDRDEQNRKIMELPSAASLLPPDVDDDYIDDQHHRHHRNSNDDCLSLASSRKNNNNPFLMFDSVGGASADARSLSNVSGGSTRKSERNNNKFRNRKNQHPMTPLSIPPPVAEEKNSYPNNSEVPGREMSMQWAKNEVSSTIWNTSNSLATISKNANKKKKMHHDARRNNSSNNNSSAASAATTQSGTTTPTRPNFETASSSSHNIDGSNNHSNNGLQQKDIFPVGAITPPLGSKYPRTKAEAEARVEVRNRKYFTENNTNINSKNNSPGVHSRRSSLQFVKSKNDDHDGCASTTTTSSSAQTSGIRNNKNNDSHQSSPSSLLLSSPSLKSATSTPAVGAAPISSSKNKTTNYLTDTESRTINNTMIVAYTQDPYFNAVIREVVLPGGSPTNEGLGSHVFTTSVAERQRLLRLVEAGIPSWAVFCTRYGIFYHRYLRVVIGLAVNVWPLIALALGLYDLYSHMPYVHQYLVPLFSLFEDSWIFRLSIGVAYIFSYFLYFFQWLAQTVSVVTGPVWPIIQFFSPLVEFVKIFLSAGYAFFNTVFVFIFGSIGTVVFGLLRTIFYPFITILSFAPTTTSAASSASSLPQYFTWMTVLWTTVLRPVKNLLKALYDGVIHVGSVIARHEASLRMWYTRKFRRIKNFIVSHVQSYWQVYLTIIGVAVVIYYVPIVIGFIFGPQA